MKHSIEENDIEYDVYVRMPLIKQYKIRVKIKSVKKGEPNFRAPEVLMDTHLPSKQR